MTTTSITEFLLWCVGINSGFLLLWFIAIAFRPSSGEPGEPRAPGVHAVERREQLKHCGTR